ncbi:cell adhesion molecule 2-like [Scyliorhinus canicula]|uniref:cell adhesion molecule 2-like n=1 Tax=Scyliorhinus canicula TaxID=7830 RepID=UPI0018F592CC|nr:cell adhesion molecule 2-like [Scyliorhinus canicula]
MVDLDPSRTRILTLTVLDPLSIPHISRYGSLESHTITLICEVQSGIANSIRWTRGGLALPDDERYWLSEGNSTLTISNAQESDSGYYTCTFSNLVSQSNNSYQLSISHEVKRRRYYALIPVAIMLVLCLLAKL